jgi:predicted kinase
LPGTGKSTLARELAKSAGFIVIRSDLVRKELTGRSGATESPAAFGEEIYTSEWNDRTYAECLRRALGLIFEGRRVLVDASFREESRRRSFLEAARRWGIASCLIHCHAEPGVVADRLAHRRGDASDAVWTTYLEAARRWEEPDKTTRGLIRTIDTGGDLACSRAAACEVLREFNMLDAGG